MTPEQLDEARAKEAWRIWNEEGGVTDEGHAAIAARLAREGWKPPEPVDPDVLAFREWFSNRLLTEADGANALAGKYDRSSSADAYLAGARMAREQERERAKVLVEYVQVDADAEVNRSNHLGVYTAREVIAKYNGEW